MTNDALEQPCPIQGCGEPLLLIITSCVPLYRHDPPWPGAGRATYDADDAVSDCWQVDCTNGHTVWTHVDQIRADNAAGLTDDDETGDNVPIFRLEPFLAAHNLDRSTAA